MPVCGMLLALLLFQTPSRAPLGPSKPDFVRDIRPIFERSCIACHGAAQQQAGLRLDAALPSQAVLAGNSAASSLYQRIAGHGDRPRMPLGGKPLEAADIALIQRWIDQGAPWPAPAQGAGRPEPAEARQHWAYVAPRRPPVPKGVHPIDHFIQARLGKEGLKPSPEADRVTLLRRLSLDLIGLPPAPEEVDAFAGPGGRPGPGAYTEQVERLLRSPHYGERWGRLWLDAARYADSDGFEKDKQRQVWFYRDWVIGSLNRDLPYDRFIIEQIAGDLLPSSTQDNRVATGFLRNSMINEEGGIDPEQFRMEAMFDRMDAIGKSILGITIQCAQCHNHKYDPLTQEEYYRMFAFLNDSHEANVAVYSPAEQRKREQIFRQIRELERGLERQPGWRGRMAAWERAATQDQPEWLVLRPAVEDISTGGQKYFPLPDGSFLAQGYAPTKHRVKMTVKTDLENITAFRLELLNDPNLPMGGPGRSLKGTGALTEFEVEAAPAAPSATASGPAAEKPSRIRIVRATADFSPPPAPLEAAYHDKSVRLRLTGPVDFAIDGCEETAWGTDAGPGLRNQPRKAVFHPEQPVRFPGGAVLTFYLSQKHGGWNSDDNQSHNLGRFRLSVASAPNAAADPLPAGVREILPIPHERRTAAQNDAVFSYWRTTVPEWRPVNEKIAGLWKQHPEGASQLVLQARQSPRETHILARGDFLKPGKPVPPGVPAFLHPLPAGAPPDRLGFARWLVDRDSPTAARAIVNRVWQQYFGNGLVATSEDLGKQSEPASHPELLDWLAVEFMERGWSLKNLHRLILTSATYRQSSKASPELLSRDPYNRLLARGPRFRVDAEIVRDIALAASGLLNRKVGGPSVYAPAPAFLFQPPASYGPKIWNEAQGEERYRRALYTFRYRSVPYPALDAFDAPNGDSSCVRRVRSNTPLQALTTLNEPLFLESARALAERALEHGGSSDGERLKYAVRRCLAREPGQQESGELLAFLRKQQERFPRLEAWTALARVLLNLDETITKE